MLAVPTWNDPEMQRIINTLGPLGALSLALILGAPSSAEQAPDASRSKAKLAQVRAQIAALADRIGGELKQRDELSARLREADLGITATRRRLDDLRAQQAAAERRRDDLRAQQSRLQKALDLERDVLASQVLAAYMIGPREPLKLLLNQSDPVRAGRMAMFYGYFGRERARKIAEIEEEAMRLHDLVAQLAQASDQLQTLQGDATHEMTNLLHARAARGAALDAIVRQVSSGSQELNQLKREEQAEESLLADIARVMQDFPIDSQRNFAQLRGHLAWPVPGRMTTRYQETRVNSSSGLPRNGVLIEAGRGAKVRAPYFGRVVYADWLPGLGLLLIIGHSGNYMTLYGHAEVLYKSVGDWVAPGDVVAALSDVGPGAPQLYFEIRAGVKPQDPETWLKAAP